MDKILLVDGHLLLFQMFFGMPSRIVNKKGTQVQAVIGFTGALLRVIKEINPDKVLVIFDGENGTDRVDIDSDYKGNRINYSNIPDEDNPFSQLVNIKKVLDYIGIKHYEVLDNNETDDHIASYVKEYRDNNEIYILSKDKDFLQLVDENVSVYMYRGKSSINYTPLKVYEKYGVKPSMFVDYKVLVGDSSDNIKGVPKIGHKTAVELLNKYQNIDNILNSLEDISKNSIRQALLENKGRIKQNMDLILLSREIESPFKLDELDFEVELDNLSTMNILKDLDIM